MPSPSPSLAEKRRTLVLLRGVLLVAVGGLLLGVGNSAHPASLALVGLFTLSELALAWMPLRWSRSMRFDLLVGGADLALVALGIHLAGAMGGVLPISCLLMALVVALGDRRTHAVSGAAAVGALHAWLVFGREASFAASWLFLLQFLFLCTVGLYYGFGRRPMTSRLASSPRCTTSSPPSRPRSTCAGSSPSSSSASRRSCRRGAAR
jgi:hypothetical protein